MDDGPGDRPLLIVDGYNAIGADPVLADRFSDDPDAARAELVEAVAAYATGTYDALLVFDAPGNPVSDGSPHEIAGVTVVFSAAGTDADTAIEAWSHEALGSGRRIVLVTSDAQTQQVVARAGVTRLSSRAFWEDVERAREESAPASAQKHRSRVEDRIDPDIRAALMRWARGS